MAGRKEGRLGLTCALQITDLASLSKLSSLIAAVPLRTSLSLTLRNRSKMADDWATSRRADIHRAFPLVSGSRMGGRERVFQFLCEADNLAFGFLFVAEMPVTLDRQLLADTFPVKVAFKCERCHCLLFYRTHINIFCERLYGAERHYFAEGGHLQHE